MARCAITAGLLLMALTSCDGPALSEHQRSEVRDIADGQRSDLGEVDEKIANLERRLTQKEADDNDRELRLEKQERLVKAILADEADFVKKYNYHLREFHGLHLAPEK